MYSVKGIYYILKVYLNVSLIFGGMRHYTSQLEKLQQDVYSYWNIYLSQFYNEC